MDRRQLVPTADVATTDVEGLTDMEELATVASKTWLKPTMIATIMFGVVAYFAVTATSFGKEPARVQAQPQIVKLHEQLVHQVQPACEDAPDWLDIYGKDCSWYTFMNRCEYFGQSRAFSSGGQTAASACCTCRGGQLLAGKAPKRHHICCRFQTAECLACGARVSEGEYCKDHPETEGCPKAVSQADPATSSTPAASPANQLLGGSVCPTPVEDFIFPHKSCPQDKSTCVDDNREFSTFAEAWAACGTSSECDLVMRWKNGVYYLRRASDPDDTIEGAGSMPYSCAKAIVTPANQLSGSACPTPAEDFILPHKSCPSDVSTCVDDNREFSTFAEAWAACGASSECDLVMRWKDGVYYLRRASDPDDTIEGAGSMRYSCAKAIVTPAPGVAAAAAPAAPPSAAAQPACLEENTDYFGHNLRNIAVSSAGECQEQCSQDDECSVFTWFPGRCYLKHSDAGRGGHAGAVSGFKDCIVANGKACFEDDTDYAGHDLRNLPGASAEDCREACRQDDQCKFFTSITNACYLKSSDVDRGSHDFFVSGPKRCS